MCALKHLTILLITLHSIAMILPPVSISVSISISISISHVSTTVSVSYGVVVNRECAMPAAVCDILQLMMSYSIYTRRIR